MRIQIQGQAQESVMYRMYGIKQMQEQDAVLISYLSLG
jgi:hypothetical protein